MNWVIQCARWVFTLISGLKFQHLFDEYSKIGRKRQIINSKRNINLLRNYELESPTLEFRQMQVSWINCIKSDVVWSLDKDIQQQIAQNQIIRWASYSVENLILETSRLKLPKTKIAEILIENFTNCILRIKYID